MSTTSGNSRGSNGRKKKYVAVASQQQQPPPPPPPQQQQPRSSKPHRSHRMAEPIAMETTDEAMDIVLNVVGVKFPCTVQRDWPCETLIPMAIVEYQLAYPTCEIPDFNLIYHCSRKEYLHGNHAIGRVCQPHDEIELGMAMDRNVNAQKDRVSEYFLRQTSLSTTASRTSGGSGNGELYEFTVIFHRLPLGFTLKQENEATVVANIYPHSAATHYERLIPGVMLTRIGETSLDGFGLRKVHDLIKNASLPLEICFRGSKKPPRRSAASLASRYVKSTRSVSARSEEALDDTRSTASSANTTRYRSKSSTTMSENGAIHPPQQQRRASYDRKKSETSYASDHSRNSSSKRPTRSREKKPGVVPSLPPEAASPIPSTVESESTPKSKTSNQREEEEETKPSGMPLSSPVAPPAPVVSNRENETKAPSQRPKTPQDKRKKSKQLFQVDQDHAAAAVIDTAPSPATSTPSKVASEQFLERIKSTIMQSKKAVDEPSSDLVNGTTPAASPVPCADDLDSNQNEQESEDVLVEHIKLLQAELIKKHEEAKQIANQLERYHDKLTKVRHKRGKQAVNHPKVPKTSQATSTSSSSSSLRLTAAVLQEIDSKSGLPPKRTSVYCESSNASSVSGYSAYSNVSGAPARASRLSRYSTTRSCVSMRDDASVSSYNSQSSERRTSTARRSSIKSLQGRYSYIPQRYSTSSTGFYDAPTTFSTRGAVISRAKATRDSFVPKNDTPGVGYYDVKVVEKVKGGEIGDADRSLPWTAK